MEPEPGIAIDLSVRPHSGTCMADKIGMPHILKPIPKPPWAILWYQNLWPMFGGAGTLTQTSYSQSQTITTTTTPILRKHHELPENSNLYSETRTKYKSSNQILGVNSPNFRSVSNESTGPMATLKSQPGVCVHATVVTDLGLFKSIEIDSIEWIERHFRSPRSIKSVSTQVDARSEENNAEEENKGIQSLVKTRRLPIAIVDIATCDGPVLFDRVLNPNFAVTVEHHPSSTSTTKSPGSSPDRSPSSSDRKTVTSPRTNTYLCICCNQSFKSMFCYQKHKKRHLNPVTVDITSTTKNLPLVTVSDNKAYTKDLNVQFFPCKKCGCKFPSYYFVHKHKKVCHQVCI